MIADAMTSIKAYLYEKAVSPLLGSLIISWCAWNYKFLLMLVSGLSFPDKLRYINILYTDNYLFYGQGIIFPFITSMAYLFVFPFPAQWVYQFSLKRQQILNELKNKVQENELLTLEQSKMIRNQLIDVEKKSDEEIERQNRLIKTRDDKIVQLQSTIDEKNREREELNKEREQLNRDILKLIESYTASQNGVRDNDANITKEIIDKYDVENKEKSKIYIQNLLGGINKRAFYKDDNEISPDIKKSKFEFYYKAPKLRQSDYLEVLSQLYQHKTVNVNDFEIPSKRLGMVIKHFMTNNIITRKNVTSKNFVITNRGRELYKRINRDFSMRVA